MAPIPMATWSPGAISKARSPITPLVHEALSRKDHVIVKENAPLYYGKTQVGTGWNAMIAMWNGNDCIGWLAADNLINQRMLTEHQKEILKLFGAALGQQIVIKHNHQQLSRLNAELEERVHQRTLELQVTNRALGEANQRLEQLSMQDGLTGIANRRFFDQSIWNYRNKAKEKQVPLSLIMIDVDHFKAYNDTYGHLEGDTCLKKITAILEKVTKPYKKSIFTRYGGEEFACLLPKVDAQTAAIVAEQMLMAVSLMGLDHKASEVGKVTISLGGYTLTPSSGEKPEALIQGADRALYTAKERGRNQYYQWDNETAIE